MPFLTNCFGFLGSPTTTEKKVGTLILTSLLEEPGVLPRHPIAEKSLVDICFRGGYPVLDGF